MGGRMDRVMNEICLFILLIGILIRNFWENI